MSMAIASKYLFPVLNKIKNNTTIEKEILTVRIELELATIFSIILKNHDIETSYFSGKSEFKNRNGNNELTVNVISGFKIKMSQFIG